MPKGDKYIAMKRYLESQQKKDVTLTLKEIERIIHCRLPLSAYQHSAWWGNHEGNSQATAWLEAGYRAQIINQHEADPYVIFTSKSQMKKQVSSDESWFNFDLIKPTSNADKLFIALLEFLQSYQLNPNQSFTIKAIEYFIPKGTMDINTNSVYGFSMMSMFSNQRDRDYFIFENKKLPEKFKEICMSHNRDNFYWRKQYNNERCQINPKYIKREIS
ncbi:MAG: hypothetical protein Q3980_16330 [Turicibacter sp.]|nr:hypothetical protein [Turicibacter sp.]MDO5794991.1 hypothetical protein [Turicibacter sp.]